VRVDETMRDRRCVDVGPDNRAGRIDAGNRGGFSPGDVDRRNGAVGVGKAVNAVRGVGIGAVNRAGAGHAVDGGAVGKEDVDRRDDAIVVDETVLPVLEVDIVAEDFAGGGDAHDVGVGGSGWIEGDPAGFRGNQAVKGPVSYAVDIAVIPDCLAGGV